jgi:large subunit ribosomal protein L49
MALNQTKSLLYLPFLRPFAPPMASTLQRFLSSAVSSDFPSSTSSTSSSPVQSTTSAPEPTSKPRSSPLPYRVVRTPSSKLPIYVHAKSGGTRKETKLRKIEGDIDTLRVQLRDALQVNDKDININRLTNHIIIKVSHEGTPGFPEWTGSDTITGDLANKFQLRDGGNWMLQDSWRNGSSNRGELV